MKNKFGVALSMLILFLITGLFNMAQLTPQQEKLAMSMSPVNKETDKEPVKKISDKKHKLSKIKPATVKSSKNSAKIPASK